MPPFVACRDLIRAPTHKWITDSFMGTLKVFTIRTGWIKTSNNFKDVNAQQKLGLYGTTLYVSAPNPVKLWFAIDPFQLEFYALGSDCGPKHESKANDIALGKNLSTERSLKTSLRHLPANLSRDTRCHWGCTNWFLGRLICQRSNFISRRRQNSTSAWISTHWIF